MRTIVSATQVSPTVEEMTAIMEYLFDHLPMELAGGLFKRSSNRICKLHARGITHGFFNYRKGGGQVVRPKAFLFYDSGYVEVNSPGQKWRSQQFRLFLLQDTSWLLVRTRRGTWNNGSTAPLTMHYHAAELQQAFEQAGVRGARATKCLNNLMRLLDAAFRWSEDWHELNQDIRDRYNVLM